MISNQVDFMFRNTKKKKCFVDKYEQNKNITALSHEKKKRGQEFQM